MDRVASDKISKICNVRSPNIYRKIARTNIEKFTIDKTHCSPSGRTTKIDSVTPHKLSTILTCNARLNIEIMDPAMPKKVQRKQAMKTSKNFRVIPHYTSENNRHNLP